MAHIAWIWMILTMYEPMSIQFPGKKKSTIFQDTLIQRRMSLEARYKCHKLLKLHVLGLQQNPVHLKVSSANTEKLTGWATGKGLNSHSGSAWFES
jgi:hypothetical protein